MNRLTVLGGIIAVIAGAILVRLFFLQISYADEYEETAAKQHADAQSLFPARGDIFFEDTEGTLVPAAITKRMYALAGNPQKMVNPAAVYEKLAPLIKLDREEFLARATATSTYTIFFSDLPKEKTAELMRLQIPGLWLMEEENRVYPEGTTASHALGFFGYDDTTRIGRYGIEQQYESVLAGSQGNEAENGTQDGYDIILTIDPHIQTVSHRIVADLMEQWHAASAGILVIQPKTGAILAMESSPSFDSNSYNTVENYDIFLNPFTQKVFEMGSIVKPLTMAAGLDAYAISENTTYYDAGFVHIRDAEIKNYDGKGRGRQSMYDILDQSLNTGAVFIMQQLGMRQFRDYMERFGLGSVTGIDLPQEISGNVRNLEVGREVEYATASFGQGIATTPIELITALSAVANGGELMRPYLVERIMDGDAIISKTEPYVRRRVVRKETSETVSRMLSKVVDKTLAGGTVAMPGYHIAAKTGTAQISNEDGSGYSDYYLHTFFGYAPAFDPQFLILLFLEKPTGVRYASQTLAKPFHDLAEFIIHYYEIPPDR
ncbi:MAG: cell division protein FtsI (penicillin-binding protein 3) [Parcubacteria group bacterium Gr01-1014_70]|nr:MAG: cell division protein FtsI (penicillin-binding protein 3) [Parcubacteria group bacterium Gr01-1014_70]